jgi:hypothetical protein
MVESQAQSGPMRTLIHHGPISRGHVNLPRTALKLHKVSILDLRCHTTKVKDIAIANIYLLERRMSHKEYE